MIIYQAIRDVLLSGQDVVVNILGYVELIKDPNLQQDFEFLWSKQDMTGLAFRFKSNDRKIFLKPHQDKIFKNQERK